jgi:hypothetical protein
MFNNDYLSGATKAASASRVAIVDATAATAAATGTSRIATLEPGSASSAAGAAAAAYGWWIAIAARISGRPANTAGDVLLRLLRG